MSHNTSFKIKVHDNNDIFIRNIFTTNPNSWSPNTTKKVYNMLYNIAVLYVKRHSEKDNKKYVTSLYIVLRNIITQIHGKNAIVGSQKWGRNINTHYNLLQSLYIDKLDEYVKNLYKTNVSLTNICINSKGERV